MTEDEVRKVVAQKGHYTEDVPIGEYSDKFIEGWLMKYWSQILEIINNSH